jgi:serine/threonine-protein kinase
MQQRGLWPGRAVALGKYVLVRALARGSMGEVWIARHTSLGREFALKFLRGDLLRAAGPDGAGDAAPEDERTAMARFRFEAQVAAALSRRSRHIVAVTDHGEEDGYAYLVMELVDGPSLDAVMRATPKLPLPWVAGLVAQLAKGLAVAHAEGVFHRDLKPANVVLPRDEDGSMLAKILDFGIAKTARPHVVSAAAPLPGFETEVGVVLGTPNYMSPEQARGLATLDHRCDVWALATIAYEALTGALPYDGETTADLLVNVCTADAVPVRAFRPELPPSADVVFAHAFARRIDDRFRTATAFAEALLTVASETQRPEAAASAQPPATTLETGAPAVVSAAEPAPLDTRRGHARVLVAATLGLATALAGIAVLGASRHATDAPPPTTRSAATSAPVAATEVIQSPSAPPTASIGAPPPRDPSSTAPLAQGPRPAPRQASSAARAAASSATTASAKSSAPSASSSAPTRPIDRGEIL